MADMENNEELNLQMDAAPESPAENAAPAPEAAPAQASADAPQSASLSEKEQKGTVSEEQARAESVESREHIDIRQKAGSFKEKLDNWVPGPNLPNQLTIARVCMIPLFVLLLLCVKKPAGNILAMLVFIVASLTDTADGHIARKYNYVTTFGKFMDPLADKLLVCSALICLVDLGRIESWIVIIIISREFIISGFRLIAVEKGEVIAANIWGKMKTVFQMVMVILLVGDFGGFLHVLAQIAKWIALALTIISLVTYLVQNRNVLKDVH